MRLLLLSDLNSAHTIKWATALAERGLVVAVFGLSPCEHTLYQPFSNIQIASAGLDRGLVRNSAAVVAKSRYLRAWFGVRRLVKRFRPDLLHAHFLTSYGLLGALAGFHPYLLSAWGSDVLLFPKRSPWHRALLTFNLSRADRVLATSQTMARELEKYSRRRAVVTPFGVDLARFKPEPRPNDRFAATDIVIGTVKSLSERYGIDQLIKAFALLKGRYPDLPLKLLIVGGGELAQPLQQLAQALGLADCTIFTGPVSPAETPAFHNMIDIFVTLSNSESFGVSVLEASACGKPVVVSEVGGLPEVVAPGRTGFIVPPRDPAQAAAALERLVLDEPLRLKMGQAGRAWVREHYNWPDNVAQMIGIYDQVLPKKDAV
jgi:glycosyltransferase involved in cell wall biosynthesis